jgi:outer membrane receptor protein involved in Fe transport
MRVAAAFGNPLVIGPDLGAAMWQICHVPEKWENLRAGGIASNSFHPLKTTCFARYSWRKNHGCGRLKGTDMRKNPYLSNLLATTIICGAVGVATPALAQDVGPAEGQAAATQDDDENVIVITGSRIPQPNLTAVSPVTVVNSQEVTNTGTTRTEDLINSLPQVFAGQSSTISNGASGTATLNLRGLGSERTLVLINGRRLVPGDPGSSAADINVIPAAMIDRVDILTGGASSVYGSDAISGVVNFIMDTDFEGIRVDGQYSFYQHDNGTRPSVIAALNAPNRQFGFPTGSVADGGTFDLNVVIGAGFDDNHGHVVAYAGYRKVDAILQGRRDYSSCALTSRTAAQIAAGPGTGANAGTTDFVCGGSPTSANGTFFTNTGTFQVGPNRTFIPGSTPYNFAPLNYYQRPDERYVLGAFANYEISPALRPYLEVMFMDDRTVAQIAPSGDFGNTLSINCGSPAAPTVNSPGVGNPLLSAQQRAIVCAGPNLIAANGLSVNQNPPGTLPAVFIDPTTGLPYTRAVLQPLRRNVEGGGRRDDLQHTSYRIVGGMNGDLSEVWSYDMYYQFAQTNFAETYTNDFSVRRLGLALDVIDDPNTAGVDPVCRSVLDGSDTTCVPWDIFATGQVTPAALNFLQTPGLQRGVNQQTVANASLTGNLGGWGIQFPWAENGVGIALGVEYRKDSLELLVDQAFSTLPSSDLAGQGAPTLPTAGEFDVREAFVEVRVPIVEENFFHYFGFEAGYRYSDYSINNRSISTDTYKIGLDFSPIRDIRFRGAYNRAVRAPNIQELFAPQRVVLDGTTDPCAGFVITAAHVGCLAQGLVVGQTVQPNGASQYNGLIGGNPNLDPEVADTWTVGVVLQPRFIPRLAITVDWFDIQIDGPIQGVGADTILAQCGVTTANPVFCSLVQRDQFGSLWRTSNGFVRDFSLNIGSLKTRGIDVQASYSMQLGGLGGLGFSFVGTWLDRLLTDPGAGADPYECVGLFGTQCGTPNPEWRHTFRVSYTHPSGLGLSVRWRYFSGVDLDLTTDQVGLAACNPATTCRPAELRIPTQNYIDMVFTARIGDHYAFRLGANNIFDRDPPLVGANACPAGICNGNVYTQVYDGLGRYIFAGVTLDF